MGDELRSPFSRVFTIEDRAGPANVPLYLGQGRAMGPSWGFGDLTPVRIPDPDRYGAFKTVDAIRGEEDLPSMPLEVRYQYTISELLRIGRKGCPLDAQVHFGKCQDPRDFNGGWDKILVVEGAVVTNFGTGELGALEQGQDAVVNESVDLTGLDMYELKTIAMQELAAAAITREVIDIVICDSIQCGLCGIPSDGCQAFFAITLESSASPGLPAELFYSSDAGGTVSSTNVTTLDAGEAPDALACVGTNLVVVSNADCALHYALIADIVAGTETWVRIATGLVCPNGEPNAIFSLGSVFSWLVGDGGHVYFSADITSGVTVQDAGSVTTENLQAIHGYDENNLVAVGDNNAMIHTQNGGDTWAAVTGPSVGVNLTTVAMRGENEWVVGDAGGQLWYTRDAGVTWTEITFPNSGTGIVRHVSFPTPTVGYLAHDSIVSGTVLGRIYRSIDGGHSWYVLPEGTGAIAGNDRINKVAACGENANIFFAGGLGDNGTDGILVKGA